ncbi:MAG TPA: ATP-binding protein [Asticcacaulis sp.]|nr:ATP-binding protein [Asticcacaulis sp.]
MAKITDKSTSFDVRPDIRTQGRKHRRATEFDHICRSVCELAGAIFDLPMAILSLHGGEALTPIAAFGVPDIEVLDTLALIQRTLIAGNGLCIEDVTRDSRYFLESAVLHAPHIRFYADMPLVYQDKILGVLSIADVAPGPDFSASKRALLAMYADQAAVLLALAQGVGNDARRQLQAQQKRLDIAADMTGFGYWTIDLVSREVAWSSGLYTLLGINEKTYRPQVATLLDIYQTDDRPAVIERFQRAVNAGEDFDFELPVVRHKDKSARLIRTKGGVEHDADGAPVRLCAVMHDITETAVTADGFLGRITDDLRAPLNEIVSYARLIETQPVSGSDIAGYAQSLLASAEALKSLIGDRLNAEPEVIVHVGDDSVDVVDMIRETAEAFRLQAKAVQTRLSTHFVDFSRSHARLDVMRVKQVLQNLISNACKFTHGGVISVTASQVTVENPETLKPEVRLHVSVRDTGIGMEETLAHHLFNGGKKGLGLSIAQTIVESLGGHIGAVSRPGEGANVWFELPVAWLEAPAVKPDPKAVPVPRTLSRQSFDRGFEAQHSRPAYAPLRPRFEVAPMPQPVPQPARHVPVDDDRINREYLRALLQDMKLDLH